MLKYNKTNLRVLSIPRGFSPCGTFNPELQKKDVKILQNEAIYRPWWICRNAVNHGHLQRKDGFPPARERQSWVPHHLWWIPACPSAALGIKTLE